jgi:peptide/nickel transport system substrate-binding protein
MKAHSLIACLVLLGLAAGPWAFTPQAAEPHTIRHGGWLDSMVFTADTNAGRAISHLRADELDLYAYTLADPTLFQTVLEDPDLTYTESYGSYTELTLNPSGPEFNDGRLNPFSNPKIREAMNRLVDRDYIVQSIFGGMGSPLYTTILPASADYERYRDTIEGIEAAYAYDLTQAQQAISTEMLAMGATLVGGIWHYDG